MQVFIAHLGIPRHVVDQVLALGIKSSSSLQTAFDLLGELIKFNRYVP